MKQLFFLLLILSTIVCKSQNKNIENANEFFELKNYDKALNIYEKIIEPNTKDTLLLANIAQCYEFTGSFNEALKYYYKCLELVVKKQFFRFLIARTILKLGLNGTDIKNIESKDEMKYYLKTHPYNDSLINLSIIKHSELITEYPKFILSYIEIGNIYSLKKEYDSSLKYIQKAHILSPKYIDLGILLSNIYFNLDEYQKGLDVALKLKKYDSLNSTIYNLIGNAYNHLKIYDSALINYNKSIELNKNQSKSYIGRSTSKLFLGDTLNAIDDLKDLNKLFPKNAEVLFRIGNLYFYIENYENSIYYYKKSIKINPENYLYLHTLGETHYVFKNNQEAINIFNACIDLDSTKFEAYLNRGNALLKLEKNEEAILDFNKAIQIFPSSENYNARGWAYLSFKNYEAALKDINKSIELSPKNSEAFVNRAYYYKDNKNFNLACEDIKKAISLGANNIEDLKNEYCK